MNRKILSLVHLLLSSLLASCSKAPASLPLLATQTGSHADRQSMDFERIGATLDNPESIFQKAGYQPLWTASLEEARGRLPKGCTVIPKAARVWEPEVRKHFTNAGKPLSTGELLQIKRAVAVKVALAPSTQLQPGQKMAEVARNVENARISALKELGITAPSRAVFQMTRADAAWAWMKSQWRYGNDGEKAFRRMEKINGRFATGDELLARPMPIDCSYGSLGMTRLFRALEAINPSDAVTGGIYVFNYHDNGRGKRTHMINGVRIKLPTGEKVNLYYDATPGFGSATGLARADIDWYLRYAGPMDKVSLERFANLHCLVNPWNVSMSMGTGRLKYVWWMFPLGENWGDVFALGNFDKSVVPKGRADNTGVHYGDATFVGYWKENMPRIAALNRTALGAYTESGYIKSQIGSGNE